MGTVEEPGSWWTLREARVSSSRGHLRGERARDGALSPPPLTEVKPTDTEEVPGRWAQGPQGQQCPITGQAWDMLRDTRLTGERGTMVGGGCWPARKGGTEWTQARSWTVQVTSGEPWRSGRGPRATGWRSGPHAGFRPWPQPPSHPIPASPLGPDKTLGLLPPHTLRSNRCSPCKRDRNRE